MQCEAMLATYLCQRSEFVKSVHRAVFRALRHREHRGIGVVHVAFSNAAGMHGLGRNLTILAGRQRKEAAARKSLRRTAFIVVEVRDVGYKGRAVRWQGSGCAKHISAGPVKDEEGFGSRSEYFADAGLHPSGYGI